MDPTSASLLRRFDVVFVRIGDSERKAIVQRHVQGRIELRVKRASGNGWCQQLLKVWPRDIVGQTGSGPRYASPRKAVAV